MFPVFGLPDALIRLVVILLAIGFPLVLIFSWLYELTPDGLKLEKDVDRSSSVVHHTGKKLDRAIIVALALALGYFAVDKFVLDPARDDALVEEATEQGRTQALVESYGENSIAVLPFVNMSDDASNEYFSDGISEELLNLLSKIPQLRVISRSSSFSFKGKDIDVRKVAEHLDVGLVLEGSVRKAGNLVRITAQLIDARSDTHLFSETYDRELENVFEIQDEIAAAIVSELRDKLGLEIEAAPRAIAAANAEAHEAYLRGRHLILRRSLASIEAAVREFEKAVELDPDYAIAQAELSMAIGLESIYGGLNTSDAIARAAPHAERAMSLDSGLAESHAAKGFILWDQGHLEDAMTQFRQAVQINPSYFDVYNWMGIILGDELGLYAEGFAARQQAARLNPLFVPAISGYAVALVERNLLDEAGRVLEKLASLSPSVHASELGFLRARGGLWANGVLGDLDALRIDPDRRTYRIRLSHNFLKIGLVQEALVISGMPDPFVLAMAGRPDDAREAVEAGIAMGITSPSALRQISLFLAAAGDYARAQPMLEEIWQMSGGRVTGFGLFRHFHAAALIAIRRAAGETDKVDELLAAMRDDVRRYRAIKPNRKSGMTYFNADFEEGIAAYLAGEREKGLTLIAESVENGFFIVKKTPAYLETLYDDPGFAPIRAISEARTAREREKFLDIVCTDNPYEAVWQPALPYFLKCNSLAWPIQSSCSIRPLHSFSSALTRAISAASKAPICLNV